MVWVIAFACTIEQTFQRNSHVRSRETIPKRSRRSGNMECFALRYQAMRRKRAHMREIAKWIGFKDCRLRTTFCSCQIDQRSEVTVSPKRTGCPFCWGIRRPECRFTYQTLGPFDIQVSVASWQWMPGISPIAK